MKSITIHFCKSEGWLAINTYIVGESNLIPVSVALENYSDAKLAHFITCAARDQQAYSVFECRRVECNVVEAPKEQGETAHTD